MFLSFLFQLKRIRRKSTYHFAKLVKIDRTPKTRKGFYIPNVPDSLKLTLNWYIFLPSVCIFPLMIHIINYVYWIPGDCKLNKFL